MTPIIFEAILFLHEKTVMEVLAAVRADEKDERLKKNCKWQMNRREMMKAMIVCAMIVYAMIMRSRRHLFTSKHQ